MMGVKAKTPQKTPNKSVIDFNPSDTHSVSNMSYNLPSISDKMVSAATDNKRRTGGANVFSNTAMRMVNDTEYENKTKKLPNLDDAPRDLKI